MLWGAIVAAAGRGTRFGGPKQLLELGGAPLASWPLRTFAGMPEIVDVVIVTESEWIEPMETLATQVLAGKPHVVVAGGATRQASVRNALAALPKRCEAVCVHDAARPLVRSSDVRNGMRIVRDGNAAVLGVPVNDTIKVVDGARDIVLRTLDRESLRIAQTPQLATAVDLRRAHADALRAGFEATDDAALLERAGITVRMVRGSVDNFKITVPDDLVRAEQLLRERLDHLPSEEEMLFVEIFADGNLVDAICREIESRDGKIDGIDRELPSGVAVRAYIPAERFEGFGERFEAVRDGSMTFTTKFSHYAGRSEHT